MSSKELEQSIRIQRSKINKLEKKVKQNEENLFKLLEHLPTIIQNYGRSKILRR